MSRIHETAVIEPGAEIADDAFIGPFCFVGRLAKIGAGTRLISHVSVLGKTIIGKNNTIWSQATLGADPQDLKFTGEETILEIGDHNEIRENVTMHRGTGNGGSITKVGSDSLFMVGAHIAHDCIVGNHVLLANGVQLAGHVKVEDHANVAGIVGVHHFCTIGQFSFVGGMTAVKKDVPPFMVYEGDPPVERTVNVIGLQRHRIAPEDIQLIKTAHRLLFNKKINANGSKNAPVAAMTMAKRLDQLEAEYGSNEYVTILVEFMRRRALGLSGRYRETLREDNRRLGVAKSV